MVEIKLVLLVLLFWMPEEQENDTQVRFRWTKTVESCEAEMAGMKMELRALYGDALMMRGACMTVEDREKADQGFEADLLLDGEPLARPQELPQDKP